MKNIIIFGNGCRENCIIEKLLLNNTLNIYTINNNDFIKNVNTTLNTLDDILVFSKTNKIHMVIFGPEKYLVEGYVDILEKHNIKCFGPHKNASMIEGCKVFSKQLMTKYNIPTAKYIVFDNYNLINKFILDNPIENYVIKLSGLAGGKGVFLPNNKNEAYNITKDIYINNKYDDNKEVIVEERLYGTEVSIMGFCNGKDIYLLPQVQDYKRLNDNNKGVNTGGMGAHGPTNILTNNELAIVKNQMTMIVKDLNYVGILYAGIMKTKNNIYTLEYNCRFGDPECQVLLNLLENDLYDIFDKCVNNMDIDLKIKNKYVCNVVLSETNYPIIKNEKLLNINLNYKEDLNNINVYTSNIKKINNLYYSNGGRIMSIVSSDNTLYNSIHNCYNFIKNITYENMYFRKDIGIKYCLENNNKNIKKNIAILSSGTGNSCKKLIQMINEKKLNSKINIIITNKSNAEIINLAQINKISYLYLPTNSNYDIQLLTILKTYNIDIIFLIGYMKIVKPLIIEAYNNKIFNIHPSLLPKYGKLKNLDIHENVIKNNDIYTGCTLHIVTENVDEGPIILQKQLKVNTTNSNELKKEIQILENDCIVECVKLIENGYMNNKLTYNDCGVNITNGNNFVNNIKNILNTNNIGKFCSIIDYKNIKIAASTDGVGSKLEIANMLNDYSTIGIDLVAMCVNDLIVHGAKPLFMLDYIAVHKLNVNQQVTIVKSIKDGCAIANCELVGGETAELPSLFYPNKYDLGGFSVGIIEKSVYPKNIVKDDIILGLYSNGVHSNGYSLILELLKNYDYDKNILLKPTKIYVNTVLELIEHYNNCIKGFVHITGGGLIENIPRILPNNLNFMLNKNWEIDDVFKWIYKCSNLNQNEMLNTFNCSIGMIVIVSNDYDITLKNKYNMVEIGEIIEAQDYVLNIDLFN